MGILTKEVEVKVNSFTIKHYESLGYKIPVRKASKSSFYHTGKEFVYDLNNTFIVKVEDLQKRSNVKIDVICDCCGEIIYDVIYEDYCRSIEKFGEYVCCKCGMIHYKESCLRTYGTDNPAKLKEIHKRMADTSLKRYGTAHPSQSKEIKEKRQQTVRNMYGVDNVSQSTEVREKMIKSFYKNGTMPTSRQQLYIFSLYKSINQITELNYPISVYSADICFPDEKLVVEYDGGFHSGQVKLGKLTQEEFNQKEIIRNNVIKRDGYKQMRIISEKDLLPSDQVLIQMLTEAKSYFYNYPNHSWCEFNISTSTVRNAENKEGTPYNYGSLRTIKESDLQTKQKLTRKGREANENVLWEYAH